MPRGDNNGQVLDDGKGGAIVRRRYKDQHGETKWKVRRLRVKTTKAVTAAQREIDRAITDERNGVVVTTRRDHTFADLRAYCDEHVLLPAIYSADDRKVSGLRSLKQLQSLNRKLAIYFDRYTLKSITYGDLQKYLQWRTGQAALRGKRIGRPVTLTTAHRELALLRKLLYVATRIRPAAWLAENPFTHGAPLIQKAMETKRARVLSFDEERRLFAAIDSKRTPELATAIAFAIDTGMRHGEQFRLTDDDLNLRERIVRATSYKGKTAKRRPVPITAALADALIPHLQRRSAEQAGKVFSMINPRKSFETLRRRAGLEDITWHDLRHTAITRMVCVYKLDPIKVMKIVGHDNWQTFYGTYVNVDDDIARSIGADIDQARSQVPAPVIEAAAVETAGFGDIILDETGSNN